MDAISSGGILKFPDTLLGAIGAWQRGWREQQDVRIGLAITLLEQAKFLDSKFRTVDFPCYRKRFLHVGELVATIIEDNLHEGAVSWTTKLEFAEEFKGIVRLDALTGAVFRHTPEPSEVVLNLHALWSDRDFVSAVESYKQKNGDNADALVHFRDTQGEVILTAPLRGSEIIRLSGTPSFFDDLCDKAGVVPERRDDVWRQLFASGRDPTMPRYTTTEGAQTVIGNVITKIRELLATIREKNSVG